jgi:hypothetical protein
MTMSLQYLNLHHHTSSNRSPWFPSVLPAAMLPMMLCSWILIRRQGICSPVEVPFKP